MARVPDGNNQGRDPQKSKKQVALCNGVVKGHNRQAVVGRGTRDP